MSGRGEGRVGEDGERALALARTFDWNDPELRERTEFEVYAAVRGLAPQRSERTGEWWFLGYDDCRAAFRRADLLSNDFAGGDGRIGQSSVYPENSDGEAQREYRRLLDPLFSPRRMDELEDDIRAFARELLAPIAARPRCELVADFTMPFPTIIFCRLMGFPVSDHPKLMRWKDIYLNGMTPFVARQLGLVDGDGRPDREAAVQLTGQTTDEIVAYLGDLLVARRARPEDDLISELLALARPDGSPLGDDELVRICFNLFLGGLDTVTGMLSCIVAHFAAHPADRAAFISVMDDPDRVGTAVEELARFESIVSIPRKVTADCPFRDADLREGDIVQLNTVAAGRDEARFPGADRIDLARSPNPHLAFGIGRHRCLGIHLARRELRIGLQELHRALPDYSLDPADPPVMASGAVRGLFTLPLLVGRPGAGDP
jgi:cytochrome P450